MQGRMRRPYRRLCSDPASCNPTLGDDCTYQSGVIVSPKPTFDGARLWSATEVEELSTAESGIVGFFTAAFHNVSGLLAFTDKGEHTIKVATALKFLPPSPQGIIDQAHAHSTLHLELQRVVDVGIPIVQLS